MAPRGQVAAREAAELVALIDRLEAVLMASALSELEMEVGDTALVLRKPTAGVSAATSGGATGAGDGVAATTAPAAAAAAEPADHHQILAPLTGLFYLSPTPEAAPYVEVGREINQGQVIGLIEAMKLFNEIKSDVRGRVVRILAENGALIKARQPILDVEPS